MAKTKEERSKAIKAGRAASKNYTIEELIGMGDQGTTIILARFALSLGAKNKHSGTDMAFTDLKEKKSKQSNYYSKIIPKGSYWKLPTDSAEYKNIVSLGKAAKADIKADKYTSAVQSFIKSILALRAPGGAKTRDLSVLDKF